MRTAQFRVGVETEMERPFHLQQMQIDQDPVYKAVNQLTMFLVQLAHKFLQRELFASFI